MAARTITVAVIDCDICDQPYERDDARVDFDSVDKGIAYVTDAGWMRLDDGRLVCLKDDFLHDMARIPEVAL